MRIFSKKKPQIPALQFFITKALAPDEGIENIELSHRNCGGGRAKISLTKKEEFVSRRSLNGEVLEKRNGIPYHLPLTGTKCYYVGEEPVFTVKCTCGFKQNLLLINGGREGLVKLARWADNKPNAIIVKSSTLFYDGEILFGRMKEGKVF